MVHDDMQLGALELIDKLEFQGFIFLQGFLLWCLKNGFVCKWYLQKNNLCVWFVVKDSLDKPGYGEIKNFMCWNVNWIIFACKKSKFVYNDLPFGKCGSRRFFP